MSMEIAFFLSVVTVCSTIVFIKRPSPAEGVLKNRIDALVEIYERTSSRLLKIEQEHQQLVKLTEEAKQLISQHNLAKALTPRAR